MTQEKTTVAAGLNVYVEIVEETGKLNVIQDFNIPQAHLLWVSLPLLVQLPTNLSAVVNSEYTCAEKPRQFYLLDLVGVGVLCGKISTLLCHLERLSDSEFEEDQGPAFQEILTSLEEIRSFMRECLVKKGKPRLVFWRTDDMSGMSIE